MPPELVATLLKNIALEPTAPPLEAKVVLRPVIKSAFLTRNAELVVVDVVDVFAMRLRSCPALIVVWVPVVVPKPEI